LQKQFWNDKSLLSFYEYLSGSGSFNIPQLDPAMWHSYEDQYGQQDDENAALGVPFIGIKLQDNGELVSMVEKLYNQEPTSMMELKPTANEMLTASTIKLALMGRAFSGKKTVATHLKEQLGNEVAVLHIDEVIKEAVEYISPKKVDESVVVDPKAKGKAKGKEEPVNVDIFEGKNTA
jgi:hypothetical protein